MGRQMIAVLRGLVALAVLLPAAPAAWAEGFVLGERPFAPTSSWNEPVAARAVYEKIAWPAPTPYNYGVSWDRYAPAIYVAAATDPVVQVRYPPGWGYPGGLLAVRMPPNANGAAGTDGELLVVDGDEVHNFWQFRRTAANAATAESYGMANVVTDSGWARPLPPRGAGIVAVGASQLAGLLVQAETDRGEIEHALQIVVDRPLAKPGFRGEAIHGDGANPGGVVTEGERLAIPPGTPMPAGLSELGRKVFRALAKYGGFVVDVADGLSHLRAQANGFDASVIAALRKDMRKIMPLLQRVGAPAEAVSK
jgi:hypothetical protein